MTAAQPVSTPGEHVPTSTRRAAGDQFCALSLRLDQIACMLNAELADHPVYDGIELQWFDDDRHGTGMLAFLSRRADRRVDYYQQRGLNLDRSGYQLGGGTRSWTEIDFDVARLAVDDDGVDAEVRFRDVEGHVVQVRVNDRGGRVLRRGGLLAPVSAAIEDPSSLLLVWMPVFDLVRRTATPPVISIAGRDARIGHLPGARLHRRHLIKYAAPVLAVQVNPPHEESPSPARAPAPTRDWEGGLLTTLSAQEGGHEARLTLTPGMPDISTAVDSDRCGRWHVTVDDTRLTGGAWSIVKTSSGARMVMDVDERWRPGRLPWLMRLVTTVLPVFRRWPTTYQWQCDIRPGEPRTVETRWRRTGDARTDSYLRATRARRGTTRAGRS